MRMTVQRLKEGASANLRQNMVYYLIVFFVFVVGIMAGGFSGASLHEGVKSTLSAYLDGVMTASSGEFAVSSIFFQSLFSHVIMFLLIALGGISIFLIPLSMLALLFRGFLIGFTSSSLVNFAGVAGSFMALLCVVLPGILIAPCYLYVAAGGMRSGIAALKMRNNKPANRLRLRDYLSKSASAFLMALVGIILETLVVPLWLKMLAGMV